ncbi:MAG: DNA polymerase III subunit beta [Nitrosomonas sp.]|nr:DNA polymerase III subunit beta [Nitrosomonas sp.]MCC7135539.1 DNA polymerase III subunit beta [Nitrosomonas sp.]
MKLLITDLNLLLKPLQMVSGVVERRQTLPILANVLVEIGDGKLKFVTSDMEIESEATSSSEELIAIEPLHTTVSVRKLLDILRALPKNTPLEISKQENRLLIISGKSRFHLQLLPAEAFPRMHQEVDSNKITCTLPQRILKTHLQHVIHAMAQQDLRYYLNGMIFAIEADRLTLVATDTRRLSLSSVSLNEHFEKSVTILPRKAVQELARQLEESDAPVTIEVTPKIFCFIFPEAVLTSKTIAGNIIDYKAVLPKERNYQFSLNRLEFLSALKRLVIIYNQNDPFHNVQFKLADNSVLLSVVNLDQEEASEEIKTNYQLDPIDTVFNILLFIEILNDITSEVIECSFEETHEDRLLITVPGENDFLHILMPMKR